MDIVVIVLVLGALAILIFKRPKSFVYYLVMCDIFLRIVSFIGNNLPIKALSSFINKYFPTSFTNIIEMYTSGIFTTVLLWLFLVVYIVFFISTLKIFLKKK